MSLAALRGLWILVGPTASGKTALAIDLARSLNAEIVSADARQVYRELNVGTGKASEEERNAAQHHLIDVAAPDETYNAGRFAREADAVLQDVAARRRGAIVAGGTGLYIRALAEGLSELPSVPEDLRERLRDRHEREGLESLAAELCRIDPKGAARTDLKNPARVLRALELNLATGRTLEELYARRSPLPVDSLPKTYLYLRPERETLYRRIDERVNAMFAAGWQDEVRGLLQRWPPESPAFGSIGYREVIDLVQGRASKAETVERIQQLTRNYAKRQYTWFDRQLPKPGGNVSVHTFAAADAASVLSLLDA